MACVSRGECYDYDYRYSPYLPISRGGRVVFRDPHLSLLGRPVV